MFGVSTEALKGRSVPAPAHLEHVQSDAPDTDLEGTLSSSTSIRASDRSQHRQTRGRPNAIFSSDPCWAHVPTTTFIVCGMKPPWLLHLIQTCRMHPGRQAEATACAAHLSHVTDLRPFCPPRVPLGFGPWGRLPLRWVGGSWLGPRSPFGSLPNCCAASSTNVTSAEKASNLIRVHTGDLHLLGLASSVSFSTTLTLVPPWQ